LEINKKYKSKYMNYQGVIDHQALIPELRLDREYLRQGPLPIPEAINFVLGYTPEFQGIHVSTLDG
jgi:hypothetical protein